MAKQGKQVQGTRGMVPPVNTKTVMGKRKQATPSAVAANKQARDVGLARTQDMDGLTQTYEKAAPLAQAMVANLFQQLSAMAALPDLTAEQLSTMHDKMGQWFTSDKSAVKAIADVIRARTLALLVSIPPTEQLPSGTRRWQLGSIIKEARVQKTGFVAKTLEAQLRARNLDPVKYMEQDIKYVVNDDAVTELKLLQDKVFTVEEMAAMKYKPEENLALMPSKPVGGES